MKLMSVFRKSASVALLGSLIYCSEGFSQDFDRSRVHDKPEDLALSADNQYLNLKKMGDGLDMGQFLGDRVDRNMTNRFNVKYGIGFLLHDDKTRDQVSEQAAGKVLGSLRDGGVQTLSKFIIDDSPAAYFFKNLEGTISDFFKSIFTGEPEEKTLTSPFNDEEGVSGIERAEKGRISRYGSAGIRLLSSDPFVFHTWNEGPIISHERVGVRGIEGILEYDLTMGWSVVGGAIRRWDGKTEEYVGVGKGVYGGYFFTGVNFKHGKNEEALVRVGFSKQF